jgi:hypothetical protein
MAMRSSRTGSGTEGDRDCGLWPGRSSIAPAMSWAGGRSIRSSRAGATPGPPGQPESLCGVTGARVTGLHPITVSDLGAEFLRSASATRSAATAGLHAGEPGCGERQRGHLADEPMITTAYLAFRAGTAPSQAVPAERTHSLEIRTSLRPAGKRRCYPDRGLGRRPAASMLNSLNRRYT